MIPFHPFPPETSSVPSPAKFTYPFCYEPHPLCLKAADLVREYLRGKAEWQDELSGGKMLGVLVVQKGEERGFLAAFSGTLDGKTRHEFFVPPVFDLMEPGCYFQTEQESISALNRQIEELRREIRPNPLAEEAERAIEEARLLMVNAKIRRDELRKSLSPEELETRKEGFTRESQFLKGELRRTKHYWNLRLREADQPSQLLHQRIHALEEERLRRSQSLQQWLFSQMSFLNAKGEKRGLIDIFAPSLPPSGAGDCCAPKLLQFAYQQGLKPLCMAEFWVGISPREEIRTDGCFYPSCRSKCLPILTYMMEGLVVDDNPLESYQSSLESRLRLIYRDSDLLVVSKPEGMLSVPGKTGVPDVFSAMKSLFPDEQGLMIAHRLDMDTSGLILLAAHEEYYHQLQTLFLKRQVKKTYLALLENPMPIGLEGIIELPLRPDYEDRPRQRVDEKKGHKALTRYHILDNVEGHALVALYPETGRTHQLRVHMAHPSGLGNPILGDRLYGKAGERLMLHAFRLQFWGKEFTDLPPFVTLKKEYKI